jgi:energy-coupling factor transport system permease protein
VWVAAPLTALTIALYGRTSGTVFFEFLFFRVSEGSLDFALSTLLRVLAVALPAVVLFLTIDPTDLADGLAQRLRLPARFVLGALAGIRLIGLAMDDWRSVSLARRARGVADRGGLRRFFGQAFALLVLSIRRGSTLATAMEARGFGAAGTRTWARESHWGARDWVLIAVGASIGLVAIAAAVLTGNWRPLIG